MPKYIEPYFAFEVLGAPVDKVITKLDSLEFLRWLATQNLQVRWDKDTNIESIAEKGWMEFERTAQESRKQWGYSSIFGAKIDPQIAMPEKTDSDLDVTSWPTQQCARVNVTTSILIKVPLESYNPIAEYMREFARAMHHKMKAKVSVGGGFDRILAPYNHKAAPLWVGWFSIYSKEIQERYNLTRNLSLPESIRVEQKGDDLIFTSALPFSEYITHGWDTEALAFWEGVEGRILDKPASKKRKRKDDKSETYIVESVDEKTGIATLKPFTLKK
jgi:hypothetical protein